MSDRPVMILTKHFAPDEPNIHEEMFVNMADTSLGLDRYAGFVGVPHQRLIQYLEVCGFKLVESDRSKFNEHNHEHIKKLLKELGLK